MKAHLDLSGIKHLENKLKKLSTKKVEWGYPNNAGSHSEAKMPYGELAAILEWGVQGEIPPRPAFRETIQDLKTSHTEFEKEVAPFFKSFVEQKTQTEVPLVNASANHLVGRYQYKMEFWYIEGSKNNRNAPLTYALKGHNRPFEDTGELIRNATFQIK